MPQKALKLRRALKSATRLPRVRRGTSSHNVSPTEGASGNIARANTLVPLAGETPLVILRVQVVGCKDLVAKDRNGFSDPFVVVSILATRHSTPALKRTLSPVFNPSDSTFDFPIFASQIDRRALGVLECVVWDKDILMKKEYLGEVSLGLDDLFPPTGNADNRVFAFDDAKNETHSFPLTSTRLSTPAQGTIQLKVGFVQAPGRDSYGGADFDRIYQDLARRGRNSLTSIAPTEGVGTIRSTTTGPKRPGIPQYDSNETVGLGGDADFQDDGGISSGSDSEGEEETIDHLGLENWIDYAAEFAVDEDTSASATGTEDEGGPDFDDDEGLDEPLTAGPTPKAHSHNDSTSTTETTRTLLALPRVAQPITPIPSKDFLGAPVTAGVGPNTPSVPRVNFTPASPVAADDEFARTGIEAVLESNSPASAPGINAPQAIKTSSSLLSRRQDKPSSPGGSGFSISMPKFRRSKSSGANASGPPSPIPPSPSSPNAPIQPKSAGLPEDAEKDKKRPKFKKHWGSRRTSSHDVSTSEGSSGSGSSSREASSSALSASVTPVGTPLTSKSEKRLEKERRKAMKASQKMKSGKMRGFSFGKEGENASRTDIVGIVMVEIRGAEDLPRLKNMTRTSFDMDPFVVISFGKKVFRTRVVRHSLNPTWNEKLLFHVRRWEGGFKVHFTILDWDKFSGNDLIGDATLDISQLVAAAEVAEREHPEGAGSANAEMKEYTLPLTIPANGSWEGKHKPLLTLRAKYIPYDSLRRKFWNQMLKQYDTDDTRTISHVELTSMLDSLGSTLSKATRDGFFLRYGKDPERDELSFNEVVDCLEEEMAKSDKDKRRVDDPETMGKDTSFIATPVMAAFDSKGQEVKLDELNFSGVAAEHPVMSGGRKTPLRQDSVSSTTSSEGDDSWYTGDTSTSASTTFPSSDDQTNPTTPVTEKKKSRFRRSKKKDVPSLSSSSLHPSSVPTGNTPLASPEAFERVINIQECPLCHRPRLSSKAETDIITHLAVCASQDWNSVGRIVVGDFVTASQAQRKWLTKIMSKIGSGDYKLGANSANIIVQNRLTGMLEEEKMQVYVRLGIRLLYKGAKGRMEGSRARRLLKNMSIKQGVKYDSPESAKDILPFVQFHRLNVDEILEPIESFKTFNQFFYRKLKPEARPAEFPNDPYRLVSAADCRLMAFETITEATSLWIKGREFTVAKLLGEKYKHLAPRYEGGALVIFRLAPQDYHRFHTPVDGKIGAVSYIEGEYYTVNPQAIRTRLDVYGENARKVVPIESPQFGLVMAVCIGAMMVGSIHITAEEGSYVKRGDEFGYFAFGGSTIVTIFEKGRVKWDEDLLINGRASLETLVRVGMGLGWGAKNES